MNAASVVAVPDQTHPIVVMLTIGKKGYIYVANSCNKLLYVHGSPDIQGNLHHCVHTIPTHVFKQQGWGNSAILGAMAIRNDSFVWWVICGDDFTPHYLVPMDPL